jgi:hypothetical protein
MDSLDATTVLMVLGLTFGLGIIIGRCTSPRCDSNARVHCEHVVALEDSNLRMKRQIEYLRPLVPDREFHAAWAEAITEKP